LGHCLGYYPIELAAPVASFRCAFAALCMPGADFIAEYRYPHLKSSEEDAKLRGLFADHLTGVTP
jgi:hypothetical protein